MPTFVMLVDKKEVGRVKGADPKGIQDLVTKHAPKADASGASGSGSGDSASASDVWIACQNREKILTMVECIQRSRYWNISKWARSIA